MERNSEIKRVPIDSGGFGIMEVRYSNIEMCEIRGIPNDREFGLGDGWSSDQRSSRK